MNDLRSLQSLAESYEPRDGADLFEVARQYERRHEQELLDIAAIAVDVTSDSILNLGLEPESNPLLLEAFKKQYPNVDPNTLVGLPQESVDGFVNGVKGKYFEELVVERLNRGESVGEVSLPPGTIAKLADSPTQTGHDVEIVNADDGSIVELLQLKATTSMSYAKEALAKYPNIRVATTSDIDGTAENILQTNIPNEHVEGVAREQIEELTESAATDVLHRSAEWVFDSVPIVPAILIAVTEGRQVLLGRTEIDEAIRRGARRLSASAVFTSMGATLVALDAGILSVPTTTAARIGWNRIKNKIAAGEFIASKTEEIQLLTM